MYIKMKYVALIFTLLGSYAIAQTNTFPASGDVGIGTTSPQQNLSVNGAENIDQADANNGGIYPGLAFGGGSGEGIASNRVSAPNQFGLNFFTAFTPRMSITQAGNVGIGTTSPQSLLHISGSNPSSLELQGTTANSYQQILFVGTNHEFNLGLGNGSETQFGVPNKFYLYDTQANAMRMVVDTGGNVGIGTVSPGAPLEVDGNIKLTANSGAGIIFPNGVEQSEPWTGVVSGGDYAESVDVSGDRKHYEPGDVLVISADNKSDVAKSSQPYSTLVAGIYATKPGVTGRRQKTDPKTSTSEVPMAMVGIVPTKVNTENGPIHRGDLLVSSSTPGYAMKGTDPIRMVGAVVGKALGTLDSGSGVIEVVVTLQ